MNRSDVLTLYGRPPDGIALPPNEVLAGGKLAFETWVRELYGGGAGLNDPQDDWLTAVWWHLNREYDRRQRNAGKQPASPLQRARAANSTAELAKVIADYAGFSDNPASIDKLLNVLDGPHALEAGCYAFAELLDAGSKVNNPMGFFVYAFRRAARRAHQEAS